MYGLKEVAQRIVNAEQNFIGVVREITGCSEADALKVLKTFRKLKVVKLDAVGGRYSVKHGIYLESDVLRNAINLGREAS